MTKRSQKLFRQWRKKNAGCMRGLISIFDFRQGRSAKKLLLNKRCGSARNLGISSERTKIDLQCKQEKNHGDIESVFKLSDTESDEAVVFNQRVSCISTLMEKEMSSTNHSRTEFCSKTEAIKAELKTGPISDKNFNVALSSDKKSNPSPSSTSQLSDHTDISAILSSDLDLNTFMLNCCSNFLECEKNSLDYKNMAGKPLKKREKLTAVGQSKEYRDAKAKSVDRIVVLKPTSNAIAPIGSISSQSGLGNREDSESISSHFSLREIKRRFIDVIGANTKVKDPISMDGVLHKIPYGKQTASVADIGGEKRSNSSEIMRHKKMSKKSAPRVLYTEASFCNEARKHLVDFLRIGSENEPPTPIHVSRALGRILSFPGFNSSPRLSPAREKDEAHHEKSYLPLCGSKGDNNSGDLELSRHKDSFFNAETNLDVTKEVMEIIEIEENSQLKVKSVIIGNENEVLSDTFKKEESSMLLVPERSEATFEPSSPSTPTALKLSEKQESTETECAMDDADRPSPISVLEPLIFEDISIPPSMVSWRFEAAHNKMHTQSRESQSVNVVASSGSTDGEEDLISCTEFNEALLFDELEASYSTHIHDPKLLFDLIDEVLSEIKERYLGITCWVSFIKPTILPVYKHGYFMKESCRRINQHVSVQFPNTLEQSINNYLDCVVWIDLRFGAEITVSEIGEYILDYLLEELALEFSGG